MASIFTWAQVALAFIKLTTLILEEGQKRKWLDEGERKNIAKALVESLRMSGYAKQVMEEASGLSDAELDDGLRNFEPKSSDGK